MKLHVRLYMKHDQAPQRQVQRRTYPLQEGDTRGIRRPAKLDTRCCLLSTQIPRPAPPRLRSLAFPASRACTDPVSQTASHLAWCNTAVLPDAGICTAASLASSAFHGHHRAAPRSRGTGDSSGRSDAWAHSKRRCWGLICSAVSAFQIACSLPAPCANRRLRRLRECRRCPTRPAALAGVWPHEK